MKDLTSAETIVMKTIWDADHEMSLSEIVRRANEAYEKDWKPQTVSTYLTKLVQKEFVRMHREGRFFFYEILVQEEDYRSEQADKFIKFWDEGSVIHFLESYYKGKTPRQTHEYLSLSKITLHFFKFAIVLL